MKELYQILIIICLTLSPSLCFALSDEISEELLETKYPDEITLLDNESEDISQVQNDEYVDNIDKNFGTFKIFENETETKEEENSLITKVLHSKITRTDIPTYLLQDDLTFKYEHGPISKVQFFGGYRGDIGSFWLHPHTTKYENQSVQVGMLNAFKNPDYKFKVTLNPIPISGKSYMDNFFENIYFMNSSIPHHQISVGYQRVNIGIEGGNSGKILPFVNRSQIARTFGNVKSLSAKVQGNYQYMDYTLGLGSSGRTIVSGFPGADFNGWINFKPLGNERSKKYGKVTIGGGLNSGHHGIDYNVGSVYIGYNFKKLWTNFEAGIADGYNGNQGVSSKKATGYAATLGWKFTPHWQLIGRIDQFDPNRNKSHDLKREYSIGLNWFIKGQALKLVLNYVFCDSQNTQNSHRLIVGTQVLL